MDIWIYGYNVYVIIVKKIYRICTDMEILPDGENYNIEIFFDFTHFFPSLVSEAFNLLAVINGYRTGYILKSTNYRNHMDRYKLIREYIINLNLETLEYRDIIDSYPKLLIYNPLEIGKSPDLLKHLEYILNHNDEYWNISINKMLDHMCPEQIENFSGSIEFVIKNYNKCFYKEYWNEIPDNNIIAEKKHKFQELATKLNLVIDIVVNRYLTNNEIVTIILKKNPSQYLMYHKEIVDYLKKNGLYKTANLINRMNTTNNTLEILKKYHRKIGVVTTLISLEIYSIYKPLTLLEKTVTNKVLFKLENDLYNMNIVNLTTNRLSIIVLSYIKEIVLLIHNIRLDNTLLSLCENSISNIYNKLLVKPLL